MNGLVLEWVKAKEAEEAAKKARIEIEKQIVGQLCYPEDGSKTHTIGNAKITVTGRLNFNADMPHLIALCEKLPQNLRPLKTETVLDRRGAKWLRNNEVELWAEIAPAIEVSPGKPGVKVEIITE